jgi:hypothetical protein
MLSTFFFYGRIKDTSSYQVNQQQNRLSILRFEPDPQRSKPKTHCTTPAIVAFIEAGVMRLSQGFPLA